ncbi:type 4a pilus biogenesis protein PilO [Ectothiorhodospiraceae bacterium WFHF3C12]|nr:type 4a pilus biogenesis protein PilO [Ectothiorhodospiraceae bacterium WFHF3C12]
MDLSQLNELDLNNAGNWPWPVKLITVILVFILALGAAWYFGWQDQLDRLERVAAKEKDLRAEFEKKQKRAANLEAYEEQLAEMRQSFGSMLRQLPSRAEVSKLLDDITQTGLSAGLEFELFQPKGEATREFYAELPVSIRVIGGYHELARFVSGVANLPRIVTLHDIVIEPVSDGDDLSMSVTAKTYRYLEAQ